jgi:hypothetical protein
VLLADENDIGLHQLGDHVIRCDVHRGRRLHDTVAGREWRGRSGGG